MAKSAESRGRKLMRSRHVSSFLEESTESATSPPKTTMSVVVDVHNENLTNRQQRDHENNGLELSNDKETKESSQSSKVSSRASEKSRNRSADRGTRSRRSSKDRPRRSHDEEVMTMVSLDLIEESGNRKDSLEEKPRRRKQWTDAATNETEIMDSKKPARKRWSKDTGVIRLPETSDDASPLIHDSRRKVPVPAPRRSNATTQQVFDNPAFVSEDEVLRIETDHNRESTRIEMGRMRSDRSNVEEAGSTSGSSRKQRQSERRTPMSGDSQSSRTRSLNSRRKNSAEEADSSMSLGKVTDELRSSSMTSEDRTTTGGDGRLQPEATTKRDRASRGGERSLFEKKKLFVDDEVRVSSATIGSTVKKKKRKKRKQEKEETRKEEQRYISVTIHRADVLEADYANVKRPMVMVHIVDARTGSYLKNSNTYLRPLITGKFDFRENRSMIPVWEEELVFEHDFDAIVKREDGDRTVILFEVIDLLSFAEASLGYDRVGSEGCWNKIAWAFLKPVGTNNILHTNKKVRLQLYRPRRSSKRYGKHTCEVYTWWQSNNRDKYPSSLLVTVKSVLASKQESVLYQQLPLNDLLDDARENDDSRRRLSTERRTSDSTIGLPKWARLAAQSCKIPNEKMFETEASENGSFYIAFSNDGKYLACVHSEEYDYPIVVYEVETSKIHVRFLGHKTFVYSLNWSNDDYHLLSASADQTARIWDIRNQIVQHIEMLPHPSYVYCARYAPGKMTIVVTGCYDGVARIWANENGKSTKRELSQELEGHEGFVNSMVFQKNGNLITADSVGAIILWTVRRNSRMSARREWYVARKIKLPEIEGIVINTIVLHPLESRLLVHSRDNGLRMMDLATGVVLRMYKQLNNQRIQLRACISPCGGLILCGGEDSVLNIWNLETGKHIAKYTNDGCSSSRTVITCVDYHPYDHILAFSTFGNPTSVRVLRFNKNASGSNVGLNLLTKDDALRTYNNEIIMNVSEHPLSRQHKSSGDTTARKEISSSRPANDHMMIQIENDDGERPWTTLRRLKEMERCWKERSRNRLHCIIEKIDSMLSKSSMFFEDEGERVSSRINERRCSWIQANTSMSGNIVPKEDILLQDSSAANSIKHHRGDPKDSNARSSSTSRSKSQNDSFDFRNSISVSLERTNALELSSSDSTGTYVVEMPDLNENADKVEVIAEKMDSTRLSDSSLASNVTFIIENERT
ncbi:jouberin-like [Nylanderia fulva]|uniref:jouberin-like n=1 Tax=Nylanderia fulva TaxID=613905 RepID=UPI0010FB7A4B|nr:jouberin-like [Nylanderia fulva]XP_029161260.1 jouberin-like [Nylanderia fulva]XP_029161261.1 jouberin-like [Nylanderia fulva]XP_029161262.1 jouberin-like [Nylanderia fulva]